MDGYWGGAPGVCDNGVVWRSGGRVPTSPGAGVVARDQVRPHLHHAIPVLVAAIARPRRAQWHTYDEAMIVGWQ